MYNYDKDFVNVCEKMSFSETEMKELYSLIEEILSHERWEDMIKNRHHLHSRAIHSLEVCCASWRLAKKAKNCDTRATAIGALLHDFFFYDWQTEKFDFDLLEIKRKRYSPKLHGFSHPLIALDNAYRYFPHLITKKVEDIIIKHMWPLTVNPPRYKESWIVCFADKSKSLNVFKSPKELPKYIGLKIGAKK